MAWFKKVIPKKEYALILANIGAGQFVEVSRLLNSVDPNNGYDFKRVYDVANWKDSSNAGSHGTYLKRQKELMTFFEGKYKV